MEGPRRRTGSPGWGLSEQRLHLSGRDSTFTLDSGPSTSRPNSIAFPKVNVLCAHGTWFPVLPRSAQVSGQVCRDPFQVPRPWFSSGCLSPNVVPSSPGRAAESRELSQGCGRDRDSPPPLSLPLRSHAEFGSLFSIQPATMLGTLSTLLHLLFLFLIHYFFSLFLQFLKNFYCYSITVV